MSNPLRDAINRAVAAQELPMATREVSEDIARCQSNKPRQGRIISPVALVFEKTAYDYHADGDMGIKYFITHTGGSNGVQWAVTYVLGPDWDHSQPIEDNVYRDLALARARCEYLNASAMWLDAFNRATKAEAALEEYNILTGQDDA